MGTGSGGPGRRENVMNEEWERGTKGPERRENVLNEEWEWGTGAPTGAKMC